MSAESPRHGRSGAPLTVPPQPPSDRTLIDTVSGFISDVTLTSAPLADSRDTIQWARFETADVNEPTPEGDREAELSPLLLILGYGSGVQVWLIPPNGEAQEVMSWRQGSVRVLRILPTPTGVDSFAGKRPLCALCDSSSPGPLYCSLSFISIRGGDQVKSIKFKNPILDVLANKRSVVVSFSERFAVFDAGTLEDRLAVTTCYPCPCPLGGANPINPLALGDRWLAYADKKLNPGKRSSGGCEGEGVTSYTATVLHAAKSLGAGLRGLGESVASSLAGTRALSQSPSPPSAEQQPGIVTVRDIEGPSEEEQTGEESYDPIIAHFVAHSDAIISLKFDASGLVLITADKRGHDFHVFRMQPHPCGVSLASVHHLYILHRGDTTAKVQDISISLDCRWAAVSTLRGTTHVFPISPYGGPCGVRTHTQPRVVNRLSRFQRSAGLPIQSSNARSSSPVGDGISQGQWYPNPRLPPYPLPTVGSPLAQIRPTTTAAGIPTHTITRNSSGRQRLSSLSEDTGGVPLLACAQWGAAPPSPPVPTGAVPPARSPAAQALYVMAATGHLLQYIIHPRHSASVAKEKVCDNTPVELGVELVAQWPLSRPAAAADVAAPLASNSPLLHTKQLKNYCGAAASEEERWLAQVEIVTHAGPHRRLWMGPQFVFKTYNDTLSGSSSSLLEAEAVEVEAVSAGAAGVARSPPVNITGGRPLVPVLIDSGSASSLEHSPDSFRRKSYLLEAGSKPIGDKALGDVQLREDLAEAMRETETGPQCVVGGARRAAAVARAVDPLGTVVVPGDDDDTQTEDDDVDRYTHANTDEALFRPVVRASACLPSHPELSASPLSANKRIPVENLSQTHAITPEDEAAPLKTEVVIPAALSRYALEEHETTEQRSFDRAQENVFTQVDIVKLPETDFVREHHNENFENVAYSKSAIEVNTEFSIDSKEEDSGTEVNVSSQNLVLEVECMAKEKSVDKDESKSTTQQMKKDTKTCTRSIDIISSNKSLKKEENVEYTNTPDNLIETDVFSEQSDETNSQTTLVPLVSDNAEKLLPINKSSNRCKTETIKPCEDTIKLDKLEGNIVPLESVPKPKDTLHTAIQMCNPKPSVRKSKKSAKNIDENKQPVESKHDDQFTVRLPSNKNDSSITEEDVKDDACKLDDYQKVEKPINDNDPHNSTEDQIWAMLSENSSDVGRRKKNTDDVKFKSKKSKKNRKMEQDTERTDTSNITDPLTNMIKVDDISKKQNYSSAVSYAKQGLVELISNDDKFDIPTDDVISVRRSSRDNVLDVQTKDPLDHKVQISGFDYIDEQVKSISPLIKAEGERKDSLESFDLPIDFESYLICKNKDKENIVAETRSKKEDTLKELFNNTMFSLQPSKPRKHPRKDRGKNDDFVSIETMKSKKSAQFVDIMTNFETKPKIDKFKADESEIVILDSAMEEFPAIGSTSGTRKNCWPHLTSDVPVPVRSYSKITASPKCSYEEALNMELSDILEPPMPCRANIHQKLAEICRRNDIAVAECDAPEDYDETSSDLDLPPCEFTLDEVNSEVMRDSMMEVEGQLTRGGDNDSLCNFKDAAEEVVLTEEEAINTVKEEVAVAKEEHMEKSSDDDNTSPVASQTDSDDKEDKKTTVTDLTLPAQKTSSKKKSRQKRRK